MSRLLSVLIPAHNEAAYIGTCLATLFASDPLPQGWRVEVLVLANGCQDDTATRARRIAPPRGWSLRVLEQDKGNKTAALTVGDAAAAGDILVYLDADVRPEPALLAQIVAALASDAPLYASGRPRISRARSAITRAYASAWQELPFWHVGVPGFGLFAMTRAGRARWQDWPDIISDDAFARLHFTPGERLLLPARYDWPMVEGFRNLVRVRRRQDRGAAEVNRLYPDLAQNDDHRPLTLPGLGRIARRRPLGLLVYIAVALAVRTPLFATRETWVRGR
ncbi:glycosyltransferase [Phaeobacter sp. HF9A]|uniref:glycosyltransferase family 2 protein n=1 Tax=Phaeobacter sp. HF9A TaxID=2721561 RepID=UPI001430D2A9|nr:glycosyltransferase [Phaeobacter sp. HF9A]NIZ14245.1 glycosyltransferase [Phaeobacter sp. HF9A]